jgi:hypothetical protein
VFGVLSLPLFLCFVLCPVCALFVFYIIICFCPYFVDVDLRFPPYVFLLKDLYLLFRVFSHFVSNKLHLLKWSGRGPKKSYTHKWDGRGAQKQLYRIPTKNARGPKKHVIPTKTGVFSRYTV